MSRTYTELSCGCLISCDGGGGLIPVCDETNCSVKEYLKKHQIKNGKCSICHGTDRNGG